MKQVSKIDQLFVAKASNADAAIAADARWHLPFGISVGSGELIRLKKLVCNITDPGSETVLFTAFWALIQKNERRNLSGASRNILDRPIDDDVDILARGAWFARATAAVPQRTNFQRHTTDLDGMYLMRSPTLEVDFSIGGTISVNIGADLYYTIVEASDKAIIQVAKQFKGRAQTE